ncbi:MAG: hypothetical protein IPJ24_17880 [bacterium]|nr:hypothetical protein [bacterium]
MARARILFLLIPLLGAWSCADQQALRARVQEPRIVQDGDPVLVIGHCYWVDGDYQTAFTGGPGFKFTPIQGAEVEIFALDAEDPAGSYLVDSMWSDENGTIESYLPAGFYRMCLALGERHECSNFIVKVDEQADVTVRVRRYIVN